MKKHIKKSLSLLLAIVMLMSAWIFSSPTVSEAVATDGSDAYDVHLEFTVTDRGGHTAGKVMIKTKSLNGQGSETDQASKTIPANQWDVAGTYSSGYEWEGVGFPSAVVVGGDNTGQLEDIVGSDGYFINYTITVKIREHGTDDAYQTIATSDTLHHENGWFKYDYLEDTYNIPTDVYPYCASVKFSSSTSIDHNSGITTSNFTLPSSGTTNTTIYAMAYDQYNCRIASASDGAFSAINNTGITTTTNIGAFYSSLKLTASVSANSNISNRNNLAVTASYTFNGKQGNGTFTFVLINAASYVIKDLYEPTVENASKAGLMARWCDQSGASVETIWRNSSTKLFPVTAASHYYIEIRNNSTRTATITKLASDNSSYIGFATSRTGSNIVGNTLSVTIAPGATTKFYIVNISGSSGTSSANNFQTKLTVTYTLEHFYNTSATSELALTAYFNCSAKVDDRLDSTGLNVQYCTVAPTYLWAMFESYWRFDNDKVYIPSSSAVPFTGDYNYSKSSFTGGPTGYGETACTSSITLYYDLSKVNTWQDIGTHLYFVDEYKRWKGTSYAGTNRDNIVYFNSSSQSTAWTSGKYYNYIYLSTTATSTWGYGSSYTSASSNAAALNTTTTRQMNYSDLTLAMNVDSLETATTNIYVNGNLPRNINGVLPANMDSSSTKNTNVEVTNTMYLYQSGNKGAKVSRSTTLICHPLNKGNLRNLIMTKPDDSNYYYDGGYVSAYFGTEYTSTYKTAYFDSRETLGTLSTAQATINSRVDTLSTAISGLTGDSYASAYVTHYAHNTGDKFSAVTYEADRLCRIVSSFTPAYLTNVNYKNATLTNYVRKYSIQPTISATLGSTYNSISNPIALHYWFIKTDEISAINGYSSTEYGSNTYGGKTWYKYTKTSVDSINNYLSTVKTYYSGTLTSSTYYYLPERQSDVDTYVNTYNLRVANKKETITESQYGQISSFSSDFTSTMGQGEYYCTAVLRLNYDDHISDVTTILGYAASVLNDLANDSQIIADSIEAASEFASDKTTTKHTYAYKTVTAPSNNTSGSFCYYCTVCKQIADDTTGAVSTEIKSIANGTQSVQGVYTAGNLGKTDTALPRYNVSTKSDNNGTVTSAIPAPSANSGVLVRKVFTAGVEDSSQRITYNYANRSAQVRMTTIADLIDSKAGFSSYNNGNGTYDQYGAIDAGILDGETQALRFRCAMTIPDGAQVTERGFVVAPAFKIVGGTSALNMVSPDGGITTNIDRLVIGASSTTRMVCNNVNSDATLGANGAYTYNVVININQGNWARSYAARGYITYKFGGQSYTVYDDHYSVKNVQYVLVQQANDLSRYYAHWYAIHLCNYMAAKDGTLNQSDWNWQNGWTKDPLT